MSRQFIGASDAPALLGLGEQTEDDLAARILHGVERDIDAKTRALLDRGTRVEPALLASYEAVFGVGLERGVRVTHPLHGFMSAAPDGRRKDNPRVVVECKTRLRWAQSEKVSVEKKFGWAGSGNVPAKYAAQGQFQLECCDADECHFWVAFGEDTDDGEWRTDWVARYVVPRDREMGRDLVALAVNFWERRIAPFRTEAA